MSRGPIPDKPADRPTVPDVLELAAAYVRKPGNALGGNLHIFLEDENLDDGDLTFCRDRAAAARDGDGVRLAEALLAMTRTQRRRVCRDMDWPQP